MPRWMWKGKPAIKDLVMRVKSVSVEPRASILKILSNGVKGTNEIYESLKGVGIVIPRSTLYYHLSEMREDGFIEMVGYREVGGGAPEKLWKLKVREICWDLTKGELVLK